MSSVSPIPYVAPWRTEFNRYSAQVLQLQPTSWTNSSLSVVVPSGQWYRVIYISARVYTGSNANASILYEVRDSGHNTRFAAATTGLMQASDVAVYTYGVGMGVAGVRAATFDSVYTAGIPDMLWPQTYELCMQYTATGGGFAFTASASFVVVEIYTEDYNSGELVPAIPTPVLP